jgi:hypothetical protein
MAESTMLHRPRRPDWSCGAEGCGEPWPCSTERAELLREYRRAQLSLRVYMASLMYDAIEDAVRHPTDTEIDFWTRFLGWIPPTQSPSAKTSAE